MATTQVWFGLAVLQLSYLRPNNGLECTTPEAASEMICSAAGTFRNLRVKCSAAPGLGAFRTVTFRVNGVDSALQCAFGATDTDIRDTTHSVTVAPGDRIVLHVDGGGSPSHPVAQYVLEFTPDNDRESIYGGCSINTADPTTVYANGLLVSNSLWLALTDSDNVISVNGALTRIDYKLDAAPGVGNTLTFTVYKNGSPTSAVVTISGTNTTGHWTGALALAVGDLVHHRVAENANIGNFYISWGVKFTATVPGYAIVTSHRMHVPSDSAVNYELPHGDEDVSTYSTTEASREYLGPITARALRGLIVDVGTAPGSGKKYTIATRRNAATVTDSPIAVVADANTTGTDDAHSLTVGDGDVWSWQSTPSGTPASASGIVWAWQMVAPGTPVGSEPTFTNGPQAEIELQIGLTWIILTARSGAQYVWSNRPLPDPANYYLGWKEPRVLQWGAIRRALSNFLTGQYETSDQKIVLSDTDRRLRQLDADKELVNATVAEYMISDDGRRALQTARTVYRGVIRDAAAMGTLQYALTIKDTFAEKFSSTNETNLIPQRVVTVDDFPNSSATKVASSAEGYLVNGAVAAGEADVPVKTGWGVYAEGDHVTFGAGTDIYTVVSMSSQFVPAGLDAETYISVDPVLIGPLADNDAVHVIASHDVSPAVGHRVPIVYGLITGDDGQGPTIYVGDRVLPDGKTYGEFLIDGHAGYSPSGRPIQNLYFWNNSVDDYGNGIYFPDIGTLADEAGAGGRIAIPGYDNWSITNGIATPYRDFNGRRYTVVYLRGIFKNWALGLTPAPVNLGGIAFAANYYGCEDVGDGSGALITNGLQQYKHTVINWCPPKGIGYQSGAWLTAPTFADDPTLSMIDEASFDAADALSAVAVTDGYRGDFIIGADNEAISARDLLARFNLSFGVECGFNRKTQFFVSMMNLDLGSTTLQPTLDYVRDIFAGTFAITPVTRELYTAIDYRHTQDFFKRCADGWRSVLSGVTEVENTSATDVYGEKTTYQTLFLYMVRGNNRAGDPTEYTRGSETAAAVLALKLARLSIIQHLPELKTGPAGFNYELGEVVPVTHYEGLSDAGWTEFPVRIERVEVNPTDYTTTLEGYALEGATGT